MKNFHVKYFLFSAFFLAICAANLSAQTIKISAEDELQENLKLVPCKYDDRLEAVKKLFIKMGASDSEIAVEDFKNIKNVVVTRKGKSDETIIVGAHYDKVKDGCGAIDNWTGIVIIANLYRTFAQMPTNKTFIFVAFDKEESGLLGSKAMVEAIPKEKLPQYCSMINLDSFGFALPQAPSNMANPKMLASAKETAQQLKIGFAAAAIGDAAADSLPFLNKKIPAITFDGLSDGWEKILHSSNDKLDKINSQSVYLGYRFTLSYLAKIDSLDCAAFR